MLQEVRHCRQWASAPFGARLVFSRKFQGYFNPFNIGVFNKPKRLGGRSTPLVIWVVLDVNGRDPKAQPSTLTIVALRVLWKIFDFCKIPIKLKIRFLALKLLIKKRPAKMTLRHIECFGVFKGLRWTYIKSFNTIEISSCGGADLPPQGYQMWDPPQSMLGPSAKRPNAKWTKCQVTECQVDRGPSGPSAKWQSAKCEWVPCVTECQVEQVPSVTECKV